MSTQFSLGFALGITIAFLAYRTHSLNRSGALAAAFLGTIVFGIGGWQWAVVLLTFFISSSILTRAFSRRKRGLDEKYAKSGERDAAQVFSNGGLPALFAALHGFFPNAAWTWIGFAAALAAVNADTWATELGVLNATPPRMITDLRKRVERGTSGGVSLLGTLASLAGSALIAILATLLSPYPYPLSPFFVLGLIVLAGSFGSLFDSLLGATVQAMYICPKDQKETEKHPLHTCGAQTIHLRGWRWLNNDWVNLASAAFAAALALGFVLA
ncbi:MAG TPA: DUF92 domain-containing protein [Anaerolineales bacterium]|jgi:uncharacterized protein (TIGR00297 family)